MAFNPQDYYFKKAKSLGLAARSIFKLEEIDKKYRIFRPAQSVLDLGAAPGSWSQYALQKIGPSGQVLAVDLKPCGVSATNLLALEQDASVLDFEALLAKKLIRFPFDVVMSDMAPSTTGIRVTDQARSQALCEMALFTAHRALKVQGHFICKLFHSDGFTDIQKQLKRAFTETFALRPQSTRKQSTEIFLIAKGYKGNISDDTDSGRRQ